MEFFSEAQTACVITDRSIPCDVPSQFSQSTGNDAIPAALALTGPRETTASLTRKMLSISAAGWLFPVIVMLASLWHFCYVDGKCLFSPLLTALFEFSSALMDSFWRNIIKKKKSSLTLNASAAATPWCVPQCNDKSCRHPHSFSLRAAALWLLFCSSEVKPHDFSHSCGEAMSFLRLHRPSALPSAQDIVLISMSENSSTWGHVLWLSQRLLNPNTCIYPPPVSHFSFSLSSPTVSLFETI